MICADKIKSIDPPVPHKLSAADIIELISQARGKLPLGIDVVVGLPGEGLAVATLMALHLNCKLATLSNLLEGTSIASGQTRRHDGLQEKTKPRSYLVVTDFLGSGDDLKQAQRLIDAEGISGRFIYLALRGDVKASGSGIVLHTG